MWVWPSLQLLRTGKSHHFGSHIIVLTFKMLKLPSPGEFSLILDHSTNRGLSQQLLGMSCSETYSSLTDQSLEEENVFLITCSHTLFHSVFLKSSPSPPPVMSHTVMSPFNAGKVFFWPPVKTLFHFNQSPGLSSQFHLPEYIISYSFFKVI